MWSFKVLILIESLRVLRVRLRIHATRTMYDTSRSMHAALAKSIFHTTLRFLDRTPVGRIVQRFTQDTRSMDGPLSEQLNHLIQLTAQLFQKLIVIVVFTRVFESIELTILCSEGESDWSRLTRHWLSDC